MTSELLTAGTAVHEIPVRISYRIIELFSGGLYSSAHKAIEELVSNSYDAEATRVDVTMSADLTKSDATMWVVDDGEGMDQSELEALWMIASSPKANQAPDARRRAPIGKFGIGKLATFVLARQLTYVTAKSGVVRAVSIDYENLPHDRGADDREVPLAVRELTDDELELVLTPLRQLPGGDDLATSLVASARTGSWTAAAMTSLRPKVQDVKHGRLKWILSTALPNNETFQLFLNGTKVDSASESRPRIDDWAIGSRESDVSSDNVTRGVDGDGPYVEIVGIDGQIRGHISLFREPLTTGKQAAWDRSHGFFVKVRNRVINVDDPLFGLPALSHSTFNRLRVVVSAEGLNDFLTSDRESVQQSDQTQAMRDWLHHIFNVARGLYEDWENSRIPERGVGERVADAASMLTSQALGDVLSRVVSGELPQLWMSQVPERLSPEARDALWERLQSGEAKGLTGEAPRLSPLGVDAPIARYDAAAGSLLINALHPFYGAFVDGAKGEQTSYSLLAIGEVLTEVYLVQQYGDVDAAAAIMRRRDAYLRSLALEAPQSAPQIAQALRDAKGDEKKLERACKEALEYIGFDVTPIGGKGTPDGVAKARLGYRIGAAGVAEYSFTYDAKATASDAVSHKDCNFSALKQHRQDYRADYTLVVAREFEGGSDPESRTVRECVEDGKITPIRVDDLSLLVLFAGRHQLGYSRLRGLLDDCRTVDESHAWVMALYDEQPETPPYPALVDVLCGLALELPGSIEISAVLLALRRDHHIDANQSDVVAWVHSLTTTVRGYVQYDNGVIVVDAQKQKILEAIRRSHAEIDDLLIDPTLGITPREAVPPPRGSVGGGSPELAPDAKPARTGRRRTRGGDKEN